MEPTQASPIGRTNVPALMGHIPLEGRKIASSTTRYLYGTGSLLVCCLAFWQVFGSEGFSITSGAFLTFPNLVVHYEVLFLRCSSRTKVKDSISRIFSRTVISDEFLLLR